MLLGMEVGLSPGEFALDGDPAPPQKRGGASSPILRVEVKISKLNQKCGALLVVAVKSPIVVARRRRGRRPAAEARRPQSCGPMLTQPTIAAS